MASQEVDELDAAIRVPAAMNRSAPTYRIHKRTYGCSESSSRNILLALARRVPSRKSGPITAGAAPLRVVAHYFFHGSLS